MTLTLMGLHVIMFLVGLTIKFVKINLSVCKCSEGSVSDIDGFTCKNVSGWPYREMNPPLSHICLGLVSNGKSNSG